MFTDHERDRLSLNVLYHRGIRFVAVLDSSEEGGGIETEGWDRIHKQDTQWRASMEGDPCWPQHGIISPTIDEDVSVRSKSHTCSCEGCHVVSNMKQEPFDTATFAPTEPDTTIPHLSSTLVTKSDTCLHTTHLFIPLLYPNNSSFHLPDHLVSKPLTSRLPNSTLETFQIKLSNIPQLFHNHGTTFERIPW